MTPFERVFGLRPDLFEQFRAFYFQIWNPPKLDPVLLELCRLRIAELHGCASERRVRYEPARAAGLSEARIAALEDWRRGDLFSAAERACLAFAESFALAVQAIGDEDVAELAAHLSPAEIVALCEALAVFDGFTRFRVLLGVDGEAGTVDPARSPTLY
jgi:alkylhydroperoxidase family enzyme